MGTGTVARMVRGDRGADAPEVWPSSCEGPLSPHGGPQSQLSMLHAVWVREGGRSYWGGPRMGWSRPGVGLRLMEAIEQLRLPSNVEQHIVLKDPNQEGKDLAIGNERGALFKGALEEVEYRDQPLHHPVSITRAVDGHCGHCQGSASPRASTKLPHPCLGVSLEVADDPCRDRWGEEDRVDVRLRNIVEVTSYLQDRNVAAPCCTAAVTVVLGGGVTFSRGMVVVQVQEAFFDLSFELCSLAHSAPSPSLHLNFAIQMAKPHIANAREYGK